MSSKEATARYLKSEKGKLASKRYRQSPKGRIACKRSQVKYINSAKGKAYQSKKHLLYKYGLTVSQREALSEHQGAKCAICKEECALVIDHCHLSDRIRGLLCKNCNTGLGMFKDNLLLLQSAREYLQNE